MTDIDQNIIQSKRLVAQTKEMLNRLNNDMSSFQIARSRQLLEQSRPLLERLRLIQEPFWWQPRR